MSTDEKDVQKSDLPSQWVKELTEEEAPDYIWATAGNLHESFVASGEDVPKSFLQLLSGGEITDEDHVWAKQQLADMGIPA